MSEIVALALLIIGCFFLVVGSLGLVRLPDLFCRMHSASKVTTLGLGSTLLAALVQRGAREIGLEAILAIAFAFLTAPVGAHMIARAAYLRGVRLCRTTRIDELEPHYAGLREERALRDAD